MGRLAAAAARRAEGYGAHAALKILFLHPKTLVNSWPVPVDTLGEIVKFPSAVYPVLAATIKDLPIAIRMLDGYVARMSFRDYKAQLAWPDLIAISCMSPLKALDTELTIKLARAINPRVRSSSGAITRPHGRRGGSTKELISSYRAKGRSHFAASSST